RLKERTASADDALDVAAALGARVYRGRWLADDDAPERHFLNSQDAETLTPYAVYGPPDDDVYTNPQQLDLGSLVPLLLAAVSQLAERLEKLEAA
ncbi:MAG TPA: hypothetical protein VIX41_09400, partial [Acidimicrobiales bacterium]